MREIEKKFLVVDDSWRSGIVKEDQITQFYISPQNVAPTVRLRLKGDKGFLTLKYPSRTTDILSRLEFEYEVPKDHVLAQKPFAIGRVIAKTRYLVKDEFGQSWDIDVFTSPNPDLVLAEIELPTEETPYDLPGWIGADVTGDKSYSNQVMSYPDSPEGLGAD